jgi:hypothetical protein
MFEPGSRALQTASEMELACGESWSARKRRLVASAIQRAMQAEQQLQFAVDYSTQPRPGLWTRMRGALADFLLFVAMMLDTQPQFEDAEYMPEVEGEE